MRSGTARHLATLVECGTKLEQAARMAIADLEKLGGRGGLIAVSGDGEVAVGFNTDLMYRGVWRNGRKPTVSAGSHATTTEQDEIDADGVADV